MVNLLYISIIILFVSLVIVTTMFHKEHYVDQKSKCYSCEAQEIARFGPDAAWMANPTKGFDDETEAIKQAMWDIRGGNLAKTLKYY